MKSDNELLKTLTPLFQINNSFLFLIKNNDSVLLANDSKRSIKTKSLFNQSFLFSHLICNLPPCLLYYLSLWSLLPLHQSYRKNHTGWQTKYNSRFRDRSQCHIFEVFDRNQSQNEIFDIRNTGFLKRWYFHRNDISFIIIRIPVYSEATAKIKVKRRVSTKNGLTGRVK